jgi:ribosomal protein S6
MKTKKYFKKYEGVFILEDKAVEKKKLEVLELIRRNNGVIDGVETWGIRRLAYPIKNQDKNGNYKELKSGYYFKVDFKIVTARENDIDKRVDSLSNCLRDYEGVLKYVLVRQGESGEYEEKVMVEESEEKELMFEDELYSILDKYNDGGIDWREEPLDGDDVDRLVEHLRNELNLINGNITEEEYEELEG